MEWLSGVVPGIIAGVLGTLAMDLLWFWRYRRGTGHQSFFAWEFSAGLTKWENAPAPAHVGKRIVESLTRKPLPATATRITNNVMHWSYGIAWATLFGVVAFGTHHRGFVWGPLFGLIVWLSSYVTLPLMGLYKPIWRYDLPTMWKDLSAHLVYGLVAGLVVCTWPAT